MCQVLIIISNSRRKNVMNTHDSKSPSHKTWILFLSFSIFLMFHILTIFDTNDSVQINKRPRPNSRCSSWFQQLLDRYKVKIKYVPWVNIDLSLRIQCTVMNEDPAAIYFEIPRWNSQRRTVGICWIHKVYQRQTVELQLHFEQFPVLIIDGTDRKELKPFV